MLYNPNEITHILLSRSSVYGHLDGKTRSFIFRKKIEGFKTYNCSRDQEEWREMVQKISYLH